jgi:membrane-anchored protein YejM (alkaline phosphatase superfamily)
MDEFLQHLAKAGVLENAVVVLHGDHGSRIVEWDQPEPSRDNIDKLSTLFAIRRPNEPAGYDPRQASVQTLFSQLLLKSQGQIDP